MMIQRSMFLTLSSAVALAVGSFALVAPRVLLESKGVALPNPAAAIWVREVGLTIFAYGVTLFLVREHGDSTTLRAFFWGNAIVQFGLFPIEIGAYHAGLITQLSGIVPNSVIHVLLGTGFSIFAARMRRRPVDDPSAPHSPKRGAGEPGAVGSATR
jgi:hypothetical protein